MEYKVEITYKSIKSLRMRIKDGKVLISAPFRTPTSRIENFIEDNQDFIVKNISNTTRKNELKWEDHVRILQTEYQILPTLTKSKVTDHYIFINHSITDLRKEIKKICKDQALQYFRVLTLQCYQQMKISLPLPEVKMKDVSSRWGSYNKRKHEIVYALELIFKHEDCCKFVIFHELAHIIEFNHSPRFYAILSQFCPNYKMLRKKIKEK